MEKLIDKYKSLAVDCYCCLLCNYYYYYFGKNGIYLL